MTLDGKKYSGWCLESISIENRLFSINLIRHSFSIEELENSAGQAAMAKIIFRYEKIIMSGVRGGMSISEFVQTEGDQGKTLCVIRFSSDSFIEIAASAITEVLV